MSKLLERLDELEKAATPGPWFIGNDEEQEYDESSYKVWSSESKDELGYRPIVMTDRLYYNTAPYKADAEFITLLRSTYPKLRAVIEAAREVVAAHSWGGIPHEEACKLEDALEALGEDV